jgi:hypothetical protein
MSTCLRRREFLGAIGGAAASGVESSTSAALGALPDEAGANPAEADPQRHPCIGAAGRRPLALSRASNCRP